MSKGIMEQIEDLQKENERLKSLDKIADKIIQNEFNMTKKDIYKRLENPSSASAFETQILKFFNLKNDEDKQAFISIICTESTLNFFQKKRNGE